MKSNIQYPAWSSKAAANFVTTEHTEYTEKKINHETHPSTSSGQANHTKKTIVNFLLRKNLTIEYSNAGFSLQFSLRNAGNLPAS
jgi:hypothetical protein